MSAMPLTSTQSLSGTATRSSGAFRPQKKHTSPSGSQLDSAAKVPVSANRQAMPAAMRNVLVIFFRPLVSAHPIVIRASFFCKTLRPACARLKPAFVGGDLPTVAGASTALKAFEQPHTFDVVKLWCGESLSPNGSVSCQCFPPCTRRGTDPMLYAILCYHNESTVCAWTPEEDAAVMSRLAVVQEKLAKAGRLGPVARLMPTSSAVTLKKDRDPPVVMDGPFAETKEQLLGFYLIECETREEALDVARELGQANPGGSYEIRPVRLFRSNTPGQSGGNPPAAVAGGMARWSLGHAVLDPPLPLGSGGDRLDGRT